DLGNTFGVSVQELMEWNQLTSDLIFVNQELIVKKAPVAPPVVAPVENVSAAATDTKKVEDTNTNLTGFQQKQNGTLAFDETTSDLNQGSVK
ncbi:LysM peptidoglycan-binding domain-containing protein, partial [Salmonella enterica subsp. enterica]